MYQQCKYKITVAAKQTQMCLADRVSNCNTAKSTFSSNGVAKTETADEEAKKTLANYLEHQLNLLSKMCLIAYYTI